MPRRTSLRHGQLEGSHHPRRGGEGRKTRRRPLGPRAIHGFADQRGIRQAAAGTVEIPLVQPQNKARLDRDVLTYHMVPGRGHVGQDLIAATQSGQQPGRAEDCMQRAPLSS